MEVLENSSLVHGIAFVICTVFGADYGCSMVVLGLHDLALVLFRSSDFSSQSRRVIPWSPQKRTAPINWDIRNIPGMLPRAAQTTSENSIPR